MQNSEQYSDYLKEIDSDVRGALKIIRLWDDAAFENFGCRLSKYQIKRLVGTFVRSESAGRMDVVEFVYEAICDTLFVEDDWDNLEKFHDAFNASQCWKIEDVKARPSMLMKEMAEVAREILCEQ